jgi:hypothetical protein
MSQSEIERFLPCTTDVAATADKSAVAAYAATGAPTTPTSINAAT